MMFTVMCWREGTVRAHPLLQGSLTVTVAADHVTVVARISQEEVSITNQATTDAPPGPWAPAGLAAYEQHAAYLSAHLHILADGKELPAGVAKVSPPDDPTRGDAHAIYELLYPLPVGVHPSLIEIREDVMSEVHWAPGAAWQTSYVVTIALDGKPVIEGLLLTSDKLVRFDCNPSPAADGNAAGVAKGTLFKDYLLHGVHHILTGYDHLLFISALVLAATTLWDLVKVVTAFTLAHTITLTLAAFNLVHLSERIVEPLISLSIVFVALQNVFWHRSSRGVVRLAAAFFFGLFHGLGFAGGLLDAMQEMRGSTIVLAILAFSLGVEAGHQLIVIPLFSTLKLIRHTRENTVAKEQFSMSVQRIGSAAISLAGLFYLFVALRPTFMGSP